MATHLVVAQVIIGITLILMIIGRTPLFMTAMIGAACAAIVGGIPLTVAAGTVSIKSLLIAGLNPVLIDMAGILLFIGIMKSSGFLSVIIKEVIKFGNHIGGGPGIISAASIVAGVIGMFVGFTQAAITGVIAGPAAIKLGVKPDEAAGALQHANNLGCGAGFAHPTELAILSLTGLTFGMFNVYGAISAFAIMAAGYWRMRRRIIKEGGSVSKFSKEAIEAILNDFDNTNHISPVKAFIPFIILLVFAATGIPIFLVCFVASLLTIILSRTPVMQAERDMIDGVKMLSVPFTAIIIFLFLSGVINNIGMIATLKSWFEPILAISPIGLMFVVAMIAGLVTQSYTGSAAIILPFVTLVLGTGADPMATAVAAAAGGNIGQYYLTGGPVSGLNTVTPVVPGSDLRKANLFQRPNHVVGMITAAIITAGLAVA
ncbi:MAG: citrate transporter [Sutterella sp.]|nr:citrate transporter [Sutterella sp.]